VRPLSPEIVVAPRSHVRLTEGVGHPVATGSAQESAYPRRAVPVRFGFDARAGVSSIWPRIAVLSVVVPPLLDMETVARKYRPAALDGGEYVDVLLLDGAVAHGPVGDADVSHEIAVTASDGLTVPAVTVTIASTRGVPEIVGPVTKRGAGCVGDRSPAAPVRYVLLLLPTIGARTTLPEVASAD
jgi:hypothetical protein